MPQPCAAPSSSPPAARPAASTRRSAASPRAARRRARRGLAPRRGHRARRGRRPQKLPPGARRGRTAVVTLEPCNHTGRTGPCSGRPHRRRRRPRRLRRRRPRATHSAGGAERLRDAGVDGRAAACSPHEVEAFLARLAHRRAAPPPLGDREVGVEPRRPRRGSRRLQPVDHRHRPPAPTCTSAAPQPTRSLVGTRHRARRRPGAHRPRRRRRPRSPTSPFPS